MKGLLLNDWLIMYKQCWLQLACIVLFGVLSIIGDNQSFLLFVVLYSALLPQTIMAYNDKSKWDRMALTMPISRDQLVGERYLMSFIMTVVAFLICVVFSLVKSAMGGGSLDEAMEFVLLMAGITILINSIYMPVIFKFGIERARLCVIIIAALAGAMVYMAGSEEASGISGFASKLMDTNIFLYLGICILIYILSMLVSMGIYRKKQL